jgi:hypothetical protein
MRNNTALAYLELPQSGITLKLSQSGVFISRIIADAKKFKETADDFKRPAPAPSQRGMITKKNLCLTGRICKILTSCLLSGPTEAEIPKYFVIVVTVRVQSLSHPGPNLFNNPLLYRQVQAVLLSFILILSACSSSPLSVSFLIQGDYWR